MNTEIRRIMIVRSSDADADDAAIRQPHGENNREASCRSKSRPHLSMVAISVFLQAASLNKPAVWRQVSAAKKLSQAQGKHNADLPTEKPTTMKHAVSRLATYFKLVE